MGKIRRVSIYIASVWKEIRLEHGVNMLKIVVFFSLAGFPVLPQSARFPFLFFPIRLVQCPLCGAAMLGTAAWEDRGCCRDPKPLSDIELLS